MTATDIEEIDLSTEAPISLKAATRLPCLKRDGRKFHLATLYRWAESGCRGVKLATVQVGATRCTTEGAVLRFLAQLTAAAKGQPATTPTVSRRQRESQIKAAEARLAAAGF